MSQKKSKEKPGVKETLGQSNSTGSNVEVVKDFQDFGKILKVDLSAQNDVVDYGLYAQFAQK